LPDCIRDMLPTGKTSSSEPARAMGIKSRVDALGGEGRAPGLQLALVLPGIELGAILPGSIVTSAMRRSPRLSQPSRRVSSGGVQETLKAGPRSSRLSRLNLAWICSWVSMGHPLERRMRLGDEGAHTGMHFGPPTQHFAPSASTRLHKSTMACTSSSVSEGVTDHKVELRC